MTENKEVTPVAFSFLQSEWDPSVHTTFMDILSKVLWTFTIIIIVGIFEG